MSSRYGHGKSSWVTFWGGKPLPPRPEGCPPADYEEFRRHVREGVAITALARASGETPIVVKARLDRTHRRLHRPAARRP